MDRLKTFLKRFSTEKTITDENLKIVQAIALCRLTLTLEAIESKLHKIERQLNKISHIPGEL